MRLKGINERIFNSEKFQNILYNLDCEQKINVCGLVSSSKSAIIYGIYKKTNKNIFVITSSNFEAKNMYEDLKFYTDECIYFINNIFYSIMPPMRSFLPYSNFQKIQTYIIINN